MEQWKLAAVMGAVALGGVAVGGWLFGTHPAEAQAAAFTECFFGYQPAVDIDDRGVVAAPPPNRLIRVPAGYSVAGAGASSPNGYVLFCR